MVNWLPDVYEVDRAGLSSASVAGLLMAKMGGRGGQGPALGAGCRRLWATTAAPALSPSCGTLLERQKRPPGPILLRFQHNRDQTVWRKRRFARLF